MLYLTKNFIFILATRCRAMDPGVQQFGCPPVEFADSRKTSRIRWEPFFPYTLGASGFVATLGDAATYLNFTQDSAAIANIDPRDPRFLGCHNPNDRAEFLEHRSDIFIVRNSTRVVGVLSGNPVDWSTYYLRFSAFLPEERGRGAYPRLLTRILEALRAHSYERVEADVAPNHSAQVLILSRLRFYVTGFTISERWGALIRFTHFLRLDGKNSFENTFCAQRFPPRESEV